MKKNLPVTQKEHLMPDNAEIVSTTDLKGVVTDVNETFIEISGFSRDELVGKSHNVVRHPDVPPAVFANMWDTIKTGKPWMGIVKNRCKNGDHYWVDAYVTPIMENGKITGYESVRIKAERDRIPTAEKLYRDIYNEKSLKSPFAMTSVANLATGAFVVLTIIFAGNIWIGSASPMLATGLYLVSLVFAGMNIFWSTRRIRDAYTEALRVIDNPVLQKLYTDEINDIAAIRLARRMQDSHLRTALSRLLHLSGRVSRHANATTDVSQQAASFVGEQQSQTATVATAIEQMSVSIADVSDSALQVTSAVEQAAGRAREGRGMLTKASESANALDKVMTSTSEVVNELHQDANSIGSVTDVIQNIAEQTNLLALNAAIEAARAGEQGRGFAVVADEVRSLATRTGESTKEIRELIEKLQSRVSQVVNVIDEGRKNTRESAENSKQVNNELAEVLDSVEDIRSKVFVIAKAVEEQNGVARNISSNISSINELAYKTTDAVTQGASESEALQKIAHELESMVERFRQ